MDTPINEERLRQIYTNMRGRSLVLGFERLGIRVEASTPEEMHSKTDAIIVAATKRQPPS